MGTFKIDVDEFSWINGAEDDPSDRCLHGRVTVQIGQTVLQDVGTVSATALYLLKSLTEDKLMNDSSIQMIPCCGFFMIANPGLTEVSIIGCDTGTDWSVIHEDGRVKLVTESGVTEYVDLADYQAEVFRFADKVEAYYNACKPKEIPEDEFDRNGYTAFWNEWHRRREEAAQQAAAGKSAPLVYDRPDEAPFRLCGSWMSGMEWKDGNLRLLFIDGYTGRKLSPADGGEEIIISGVDTDLGDVYLLSRLGNPGNFSGKKLTLTDFLRDYPAFIFIVQEEMTGCAERFGGLSVCFQGMFCSSEESQTVEAIFVIRYDGQLTYRVQV